MDVHHCLSVGYHRPVPSPMAGRHDLEPLTYKLADMPDMCGGNTRHYKHGSRMQHG